jgi:hypothetical protein
MECAVHLVGERRKDGMSTTFSKEFLEQANRKSGPAHIAINDRCYLTQTRSGRYTLWDPYDFPGSRPIADVSAEEAHLLLKGGPEGARLLQEYQEKYDAAHQAAAGDCALDVIDDGITPGRRCPRVRNRRRYLSSPEYIRGRISLLLLWILGVPIPILFLIFLFRGCSG